LGQEIEQEQLSTDPQLPVERWTMPETGNRYLRVIAQPGDLRLRYEAEVALEPQLEDPASVIEVAAAKLPCGYRSHDGYDRTSMRRAIRPSFQQADESLYGGESDGQR
jgi:hypothetical protein